RACLVGVCASFIGRREGQGRSGGPEDLRRDGGATPRAGGVQGRCDFQTAGLPRLRRATSFGLASRRRISADGSPRAAFPPLPPSCQAISASVRRLTTERGCVVAMSSTETKLSRCLMSSQAG